MRKLPPRPMIVAGTATSAAATTTPGTLLLLALPASGKSEVRRYLATARPDRTTPPFGMGPTVQLDDYPYVHLMRRISAELRGLGEPPPFFASDETPFVDPYDWGTLIHLVNEDYAALDDGVGPQPISAADWLLRRLDRARSRVGLPSVLASVSDSGRATLLPLIEDDARALWAGLLEVTAKASPGKATIVIEFARGGPEGSTPPIPAPRGYSYSLRQLSPEILEQASILYVWVTPEESRRRNDDRARPGREGDASILHHGVPNAVMRQDYGIDDLMWLVETSDQAGTVRVEAHNTVHHVPVAIFDNRADKTSFLRADPEDWPAEDIANLHDELARAFTALRR